MFLMLELTFKDFDIMFFYDRWEVTVLIDFKADPTRCSVVGGILLILQVVAEVRGSVSKAGLGKALSLLSKRPRRRFCAQRCLILDSPGVWFPLWIVLVSWVYFSCERRFWSMQRSSLNDLYCFYFRKENQLMKSQVKTWRRTQSNKVHILIPYFFLQENNI